MACPSHLLYLLLVAQEDACRWHPHRPGAVASLTEDPLIAVRAVLKLHLWASQQLGFFQHPWPEQPSVGSRGAGSTLRHFGSSPLFASNCRGSGSSRHFAGSNLGSNPFGTCSNRHPATPESNFRIAVLAVLAAALQTALQAALQTALQTALQAVGEKDVDVLVSAVWAAALLVLAGPAAPASLATVTAERFLAAHFLAQEQNPSPKDAQ